jgi:hypothetical protein
MNKLHGNPNPHHNTRPWASTCLKFVVSLGFVSFWHILNLTKKFEGNYFGHAFSKAYYYVSINEKVCKGLKYVYVKIAQFDL